MTPEPMRVVEVVPHDPGWRHAFRLEAAAVATALGETLVAVHHIGSTAIPTIHAKPVIDLLVEVRQLDEVDRQSRAMEGLGYQALGECGIPGRRYFRKSSATGIRTHHVHVFLAASDQIRRHLAFRDYLLAHPRVAREYSELKRRLAQQFPADIHGYMDGKDAFIREVDRMAAEWTAKRMA